MFTVNEGKTFRKFKNLEKPSKWEGKFIKKINDQA